MSARKPKVMLVAPLSPEPIIGGIENGVRLYLRSSLPREFDLCFFNSYRQPSQLRIWLRIASQMKIVAQYLFKMLQHRPQVVHVKSSSGLHFYQQAVYGLLALLLGRPLIFQIHSGRFEDFFLSQPRWRRWLSQKFLKGAFCIICLTPFWKDVIGRLCPGSRLKVIANAVDLRAFDSCRHSQLQRLRSQSVTLLFIGTTIARLNRAKGLYDLLHAVEKLAPGGQKIKIVLAGCDLKDTEEAKSISSFRERVTWPTEILGVMDEPTKIKLFSEADIFVLPSHVENLPNTLLEAMAAGLPVVATRVGGIPDVVEHNQNGILVNARNPAALQSALKQLIEDSESRRCMGVRNLAVIKERFDSPKIHSDLSKLYYDAIQRRSKRTTMKSGRSAHRKHLKETSFLPR